MRLTKCPVCSIDIPQDYGMAMEIWEQCPVDSAHYDMFFSIFAARVKVNGRKFDLDSKDGVKEWHKFVKDGGFK